MDNSTVVLDLLDQLEDLVENAKGIPVVNKIVVDPNDVFEIIKSIRIALPDDMKQAAWIVEERDKIINDARVEYGKVLDEAHKQADYLVETDEITKKATKHASEIVDEARTNASLIKMKSYDYIDKIIYQMKDRIDELNTKYCGEMFEFVTNTFEEIGAKLEDNRREIKALAQNEEDSYSSKNNEF